QASGPIGWAPKPSDTKAETASRQLGPRPVHRLQSTRRDTCLSPDRARSGDKQWLRISCFAHPTLDQLASQSLFEINCYPGSEIEPANHPAILSGSTSYVTVIMRCPRSSG